MKLGWHSPEDQRAAMARKTAPEVPAMLVKSQYRVWCEHCAAFHFHEHARYYAQPCVIETSPFNVSGYNVRFDPEAARAIARSQRAVAAIPSAADRATKKSATATRAVSKKPVIQPKLARSK